MFGRMIAIAVLATGCAAHTEPSCAQQGVYELTEGCGPETLNVDADFVATGGCLGCTGQLVYACELRGHNPNYPAADPAFAVTRWLADGSLTLRVTDGVDECVGVYEQRRP